MTVIWWMVPEILSTTDRIFCHFGPFFALLTPKKPKNQNFEKTKKTPGDIIILHRCTINDDHMMYGSWDTEGDRQNVLSFYPPNNLRNQNLKKDEKSAWRYYHFKHVYHNLKSYDVWFLRYEAWRTDFFVILDRFLHFYPPNNPKNQNFKKMKEKPGDIIILHMYTINNNHIMYSSWDMERDKQFFVILDHFLSF